MSLDPTHRPFKCCKVLCFNFEWELGKEEEEASEHHTDTRAPGECLRMKMSGTKCDGEEGWSRKAKYRLVLGCFCCEQPSFLHNMFTLEVLELIVGLHTLTHAHTEGGSDLVFLNGPNCWDLLE